jgi:hypothetical protein
MMLVPAETPDTTPVDETVATDVEPLVHAPPDVASVRLVVLPAQTLAVPVMAAGDALTVTTVVTWQPVVRE